MTSGVDKLPGRGGNPGLLSRPRKPRGGCGDQVCDAMRKRICLMLQGVGLVKRGLTKQIQIDKKALV
eukprot:7896050-Prorocentrum_lima.AAC.1